MALNTAESTNSQVSTASGQKEGAERAGSKLKKEKKRQALTESSNGSHGAASSYQYSMSDDEEEQSCQKLDHKQEQRNLRTNFSIKHLELLKQIGEEQELENIKKQEPRGAPANII